MINGGIKNTVETDASLMIGKSNTAGRGDYAEKIGQEPKKA